MIIISELKLDKDEKIEILDSLENFRLLFVTNKGKLHIVDLDLENNKIVQIQKIK